MSNVPEYIKTVWEDAPSEETPINAENLNKIENQVESLTNHVIEENLKIKLVYKGEVALLSSLPTTGQKVGDYYIVVEKGVPYLWNGDSFNPQVIIPEMNVSEQSIGTLISSADVKVTPDVDDTFGYSDSEDVSNPNILKKFTWGNLRGSLAMFFEGMFALVLHGHSISDITSLQTSLDAKAPYTSLRPKNWIINGMFDAWQRATSQTSSGYGSDDRFINEHGGSTKVHSQQAFPVGQTTVPNNPKYFSRTVVTSVAGVGNYVAKIQRIEDVTKLAGKTVAISFWAKADANKNIAIEFRQNFGTGGSVAVSEIGVQKFALTTSWQRFTKLVTLPSVVGKTITADSYLQMTIWFEAGSNFNLRTDSLGQQSGTFDLSNICIVEGSVATECQNQPYADVLRDCLRYYERGFQGANGVTVGTTEAYMYARLKAQKRMNPVCSLVSGTSLASCVSEIGVAERTPTSLVFANSTEYIGIITAGATYSASGKLVVFRFDIVQADAEL